jgi:hypothetical protein
MNSWTSQEQSKQQDSNAESDQLASIASDYDRAEATVAWIEDRSSKSKFLVFGVVELCPADQPPSASLGDSQHRQVRGNLDKHMTLYIRRERVKVMEGLDFFRGSPLGRRIPGDLPDAPLLQTAEVFEDATSHEEVVLIPSNLCENSDIGAVLPRRNTNLGLLSKYDTRGATAAQIGDSAIDKLIEQLRATLGIDLSHAREQIGALHLCFANPIIRRINCSLTADESQLLVSMYARAGRTVSGCMLELAHKWPAGIGYHYCRISERLTQSMCRIFRTL